MKIEGKTCTEIQNSAQYFVGLVVIGMAPVVNINIYLYIYIYRVRTKPAVFIVQLTGGFIVPYLFFLGYHNCTHFTKALYKNLAVYYASTGASQAKEAEAKHACMHAVVKQRVVSSYHQIHPMLVLLASQPNSVFF